MGNRASSMRAHAILDNEGWLIKRILKYAIDQGYAKYTSTLEEAWRLSIQELSKILVGNLEKDIKELELRPEDSFKDDPASAFGILEADRHRQRGTPLTMFLAFYKYYLQTYLDLIKTLDLSAEEADDFSLRVTRIFDRVELGYLHKWTSLSDEETVSELQQRNLKLTNEKNMFLTVAESIQAPVIYLDDESKIVYMNSSAPDFIGGEFKPGESYYSPNEDERKIPDWLKSAISGMEKMVNLS